MNRTVSAAQIAAVRRFNRFYTRLIGVLQEHLLDSEFSLTEVRVLYELAHRSRPTATELGRVLRLDPGYLSRLLRRFERHGLLTRTRSRSDARHSHLMLTAQGRAAFAPLDRRSSREVGALLQALSEVDRQQAVASMRRLEKLFGNGGESPPPPVVLRAPRPGDLGWVVQRHGEIYYEEYGWDQRFEMLVAEVAASYLRNFEPDCDRGWIAELDGCRVGCVFVVRESRDTARLRLLLVEPDARGLGIGRKLVQVCSEFARGAGYARIVLWTNSNLLAARHLYERAGYTLQRVEPHSLFGDKLHGETWELLL